MVVFLFALAGWASLLCLYGMILLRGTTDAFTAVAHRPQLGRRSRSSMTASRTGNRRCWCATSSNTAESASSSSSSSITDPTATPSVSADTTTTTAPIDPKDIVRLFGRLAEKYIALDASAGKCCYSGCTGCEYRLPGGGYRMAEQTAARVKWIPTYDARATAVTVHRTKWSTSLFLRTADTNQDKPEEESSDEAAVSLSKEQFLERVQALDYAPPLGGPYVGASAATFESSVALERFYQILTKNESRPLTIQSMKRQLQKMARGEEGITWAVFERVLLDQDR
jgi:hypothetical protein